MFLQEIKAKLLNSNRICQDIVSLKISRLNTDLIEHLIQIVLGNFTRAHGMDFQKIFHFFYSTKGEENISIQILFADHTLISTRFLPFD